MKDDKSRTIGAWLATLADSKPKSRPDELNIFSRWHLSPNDYAANAIAERLEEAAKDWSPAYREEVLRTVESIAKAELAKSSWNPKDEKTRRGYEQIARDALAAARLARAIALRIPPSLHEESALKDLVARLAAFASASLHATSVSDVDLAASYARAMIERLNKKPPKKPASRQLIADLVWLAANKNTKQSLNESTLRRYGSGRSLTPAARYWRRSWSLMRETGPLGRNEHHDKFESEINQLLPGKKASSRSAQ